VAEHLVHFNPGVVDGVPVQVDVDRAGRLEQAVHFLEPGHEPCEVVGHRPHVGEASSTGLVAVVAAREEWGVGVDQVNGVGGKLVHDGEVVSVEQAIGHSSVTLNTIRGSSLLLAG